MGKIISNISMPIKLREILNALPRLLNDEDRYLKEFYGYFSKFVDKKYVFSLNSGVTSFFIILKVLKEKYKKNEIILPAYTASSLIMAIKKAGLKPVLGDISLSDFNTDYDLLPRVISQDTLAVLGIHMFGIVAAGLKDLKAKFPEILIIEDCAQSLGSKVDGASVGNLGEVSFFSFNRGKNLPTYSGGCIATNNESLASDIQKQMEGIKQNNFLFKLSAFFNLSALYFITRPVLYDLLNPLIAPLKKQLYLNLNHIEVKRYTAFQVAVGLSIFKRIEELSKKRYDNGMKLIEALKDIEGLILPAIAGNTRPAFNRLPIIFKDLKNKARAEKDLGKAGVETSGMYLQPLHHIFYDLGYKKDDFPKANYLAEHLLTIPAHPLVSETDLDKIISIIRRQQ